ncbi:MAG: tyrosine-type recombinase/integrase [Roseofilum sp. SID2]|uniref:tyrosine-type recombinase/integrase n=1 Tax=unclassified Roseofilum TaxID=2620099 RepID=UPI001B1A37A7|nr:MULTISPECIES: tyrosine-type recombinase/integrase [unclassified Roseofilum]MBP0011776.1 tyrosine-type recombinase/integrase [Roseofilum sp. SID3]MBP0023890.1 tyrosine-type recombinase/integrase [Roseofilum sp. SID2]
MKTLSVVKASSGKFDRVARLVTLENRDGRIYLRWSFGGKRYSLTIPGGISPVSIAAAYARANAIAADITLGKFDPSLMDYDPNREARAQQLRLKNQPTIRDLWERYKLKQSKISSPTTQKTIWREIDRALDSLPRSALNLENLENLGQEYMKLYSVSVCDRHFGSLQPAIRQRLPHIKLKTQLPKIIKRPIECFTSREVKIILESFELDRFSSPSSSFPHSYYHSYVSFLAYTGCRPEEAIALSWADIFFLPNGAGSEALINKAFSKGLLKSYTKNYLIRTIPISPSLQEILNPFKRQSGLLFPSVRGKHIDQHNFSVRIWKPILNQLVLLGEIRKYLRPYCLRHSFVTNIHYDHGIPFPTIAQLIGDKLETVIKFYSASKPLTSKSFPDLY